MNINLNIRNPGGGSRGTSNNCVAEQNSNLSSEKD